MIAGLAQLSQASVRSFEQKASAASTQLKQAAQGGSGAQWEEAAQHAQRFEHLAGMPSKPCLLLSLQACKAQSLFNPQTGNRCHVLLTMLWWSDTEQISMALTQR